VAFLGFENWSLKATIRPDSAALRNQIGTGLPGQAGNVVQFLNYRLDQFVLRGLSSRGNVGIYAVAAGMSETVWWVANSVAVALLPRLTRMDTERGAEVTSVACRNTLLVALVAAGGLAAVSPLAVRLLFGSAFTDATSAILLLMPGIVAMSGAKVLSSYLFSQGKMAVTSLLAIVALGGTLLFDVLLIPRFGINGAAAASSIAYTTSLALTLVYYQRFSGSSVLDCLFVRRADLRLYLDAARRARQRISGRRALPGHEGVGCG
jgi:O-antigen/teichoic acid export membrane protein